MFLAMKYKEMKSKSILYLEGPVRLFDLQGLDSECLKYLRW